MDDLSSVPKVIRLVGGGRHRLTLTERMGIAHITDPSLREMAIKTLRIFRTCARVGQSITLKAEESKSHSSSTNAAPTDE